MRDGTEKFAWVFNAVSNSVTKLDVSNINEWKSIKTIQLDDPTLELYKEGRICLLYTSDAADD